MDQNERLLNYANMPPYLDEKNNMDKSCLLNLFYKNEGDKFLREMTNFSMKDQLSLVDIQICQAIDCRGSKYIKTPLDMWIMLVCFLKW